MTLILVVLAFAACAWFGVLLLQQNGRILARLEALEVSLARLAAAQHFGKSGERTPTEPSTFAKSRLMRDGLERGTIAPDFRLPRVGGGELSLAAFRGRPLLLVFSDPECAPCDVLAPQLERQRRSEGVEVLMVSRGDPQANEAKRREHRLSFPIVLQRQWEVSKLYAMFATPIAYLIDEDGVISAPVAKGPDAILGLVSRAASVRATISKGSHGTRS